MQRERGKEKDAIPKGDATAKKNPEEDFALVTRDGNLGT